jgi:hypothetical protein
LDDAPGALAFDDAAQAADKSPRSGTPRTAELSGKRGLASTKRSFKRTPYLGRNCTDERAITPDCSLRPLRDRLAEIPRHCSVRASRVD